MCNSLQEFFKDKMEEIKKDGFTKDNLRKLFYKNTNGYPESLSLISSVHGKLKAVLIAPKGEAARADCKLLVEYDNNSLKNMYWWAMVDMENACKGLNSIKWLNTTKGEAPRIESFFQDMIVVIKDLKTQKLWLVDHCHGNDSNTAEQIYSTYQNDLKDFGYASLPFFLPGGDILIGDHFIFIGFCTFQRNLDEFSKHEILKKAIEKYYKEVTGTCASHFRDAFLLVLNHVLDTSRKIIIFPNEECVVEKEKERAASFDPVKFREHLDWFLTLGGEDEDGNYLIFLGKPKNISINDNSRDTFFATIDSWWEDTRSWLISQNSGTDNRKFKIIELPIPCISYNSSNSRSKKIWTAYSYNNCLVEDYKGQKSILVPKYADSRKNGAELCAYDNRVVKIFDCAGFKEIKKIGKLSAYLENGKGSLHCLTKDLIRE